MRFLELCPAQRGDESSGEGKDSYQEEVHTHNPTPDQWILLEVA